MKKKIIISVIAVLVVVGGFRVARGSGQPQNFDMQIQVERVQRDTIVSEVTAKGEVSLLNSEIIYSNTTSEVEEVFVEENDIVTEGQVLISFKESSRQKLETQLATAQLTLRNAEISLEAAKNPPTQSDIQAAEIEWSNAIKAVDTAQYDLETHQKDIDNKRRDIDTLQNTYNNTKSLHDAGAATKDELDKAYNALVDAQEELNQMNNRTSLLQSAIAKAEDNVILTKNRYDDLINQSQTADYRQNIAQKEISVQQARLNVQDFQREINEFQKEIVSPISGTITELQVSKGEVTPTDKALMKVSNLEDYVIKINVKERDAPKIKLGQEAAISGDVLGDEVFTGKVTKIANFATENSTSNGVEKVVAVEITVDSNTDLLKPGYSMEASIITSVSENILVVPILSTMNDIDGSTFVYVVNDDNILEKRTVTVGTYSDMTVEVSGVEEGERIVSQPTAMLYEGMPITPLEIGADLDTMTDETAGE